MEMYGTLLRNIGNDGKTTRSSFIAFPIVWSSASDHTERTSIEKFDDFTQSNSAYCRQSCSIGWQTST